MKTLTSMKSVEGNIQGFILSIVGVAVVLAVGLIVLANVQNTVAIANTCNDATIPTLNGTNVAECYNATGATTNISTHTTVAYNATGSILSQMATIPNWIGIIITVALAFIVLGYFYNRM